MGLWRFDVRYIGQEIFLIFHFFDQFATTVTLDFVGHGMMGVHFAQLH